MAVERDHYDQALAEVLAETRTANNLTQSDVAEAMGGDTTVGRVSCWERGTVRLPTVDFMRLALKVHGIHPSELMQQVERRLLEDGDETRYYS